MKIAPSILSDLSMREVQLPKLFYALKVNRFSINSLTYGKFEACYSDSRAMRVEIELGTTLIRCDTYR